MSQIIEAIFPCSMFFKVPKHIDLNDKSQVKEYFVKYHFLYIVLASGETICLEANLHDEDCWKYPTETRFVEEDDSVYEFLNEQEDE